MCNNKIIVIEQIGATYHQSNCTLLLITASQHDKPHQTPLENNTEEKLNFTQFMKAGFTAGLLY